MLNHFQKQDLLVDGAITNLRPMHINLKKPKKFTQGYYTTSDGKEEQEEEIDDVKVHNGTTK